MSFPKFLTSCQRTLNITDRRRYLHNPSWQDSRPHFSKILSHTKSKHVEEEDATRETKKSTVVHVSKHGRRTEIARNTNLLSTKILKNNKALSLTLLTFLSSLSLSLSLFHRVCQLQNFNSNTTMTIVATAAALSLPISLCRSSKLNTKKVLSFLLVLLHSLSGYLLNLKKERKP